jgi:hypothetical protein
MENSFGQGKKVIKEIGRKGHKMVKEFYKLMIKLLKGSGIMANLSLKMIYDFLFLYLYLVKKI